MKKQTATWLVLVACIVALGVMSLINATEISEQEQVIEEQGNEINILLEANKELADERSALLDEIVELDDEVANLNSYLERESVE